MERDRKKLNLLASRKWLSNFCFFFRLEQWRGKSCSVHVFPFIDGYTVSDVVMFWRETPVVGVEDAELPQVRTYICVLVKHDLLICCFWMRSSPSSDTKPMIVWKSWPQEPISGSRCPSVCSATLATLFSKLICRRSWSSCFPGSLSGSTTKPPVPALL